jgi:Ca2+-binding RTX toxin-like protein
VASYEDAAAGVVADLATGRGYGDAAGDTYLSIENLLGSGYGDILIGNEAANGLSATAQRRAAGSGGADTLMGGSGHDTLVGGSVMDYLAAAPARRVPLRCGRAQGMRT